MHAREWELLVELTPNWKKKKNPNLKQSIVKQQWDKGIHILFDLFLFVQ